MIRACDMDNLESKVKEVLKDQIAGHLYNMWIAPLRIVGLESDTIEIICKNKLTRERVVKNYSLKIKESISSVCGKENFKIVFKTGTVEDIKADDEKAGNSHQESIVKPTKKPAKKKAVVFSGSAGRQLGFDFDQDMPRALRKDFTLDNFIVGRNSDIAYAATLAMMSGSKMAYNSIFMQSLPGLGKSHLAQAAGNHVLTHDPLKSVYYVSAEDFTNEMVRSLQNDRLNAFKEKYRTRCDVLLMDDVHMLSGKQRTQKELTMILDYLMDADKKIIFSSCHSPQEIPKLDSQLRSRMSSSLMSEIGKPDFETRRKIAAHKARLHGYNLSNDIIDYVASELTESVRQLDAGIVNIGTKHALIGTPLTYDFAREVLQGIVENSKEITIENIKKLVAEKFGIEVEGLLSKSRKQVFAKPRQVAIFLCRKYTEQSLQQIAKSFNRYHATAIHSIKAVEKEIKSKSMLGKQVDLLSQSIEKGEL